MVSSYVQWDENEKSIIPSQGLFCVSTGQRDYRKSNKVVYTGISINLGKL
jgi:hypothetical protein